MASDEWDYFRASRVCAYRSYRSVAQEALTSCFNDLFPRALEGHDFEKLTDTLFAQLVESAPPHADAVNFLERTASRISSQCPLNVHFLCPT